MIIKIKEDEYKVNDDLIFKILIKFKINFIEYYNNLSPVIKTMVETFCRNKLYEIEKDIYEKNKNKEEAQKIRPGKNQNPSDKLMELIIINISEFLKNNVKIKLQTSSKFEISDITYELPSEGETR